MLTCIEAGFGRGYSVLKLEILWCEHPEWHEAEHVEGRGESVA